VFGINLEFRAGPNSNDVGRQLIGYVNFFDSTETRSATRSFDITDIVRDLRKQKRLKWPATVVFVASDEPAEDAKATIGSVQLVESSVDRQ